MAALQNDIDSMNKHLDFTYDPVNYKGLPEFILQLRNEYGQHYIVITDPGISNSQPAGTYPPYDDAAGLWVNLTAGEPFVGPVWPGPCVFPDFFNPKTMQYWENQLHTFRNVRPALCRGLVVHGRVCAPPPLLCRAAPSTHTCTDAVTCRLPGARR